MIANAIGMKSRAIQAARHVLLLYLILSDCAYQCLSQLSYLILSYQILSSILIASCVIRKRNNFRPSIISLSIAM